MNTYAIEYACQECSKLTTIIAYPQKPMANGDFMIYTPFCCSNCGHDVFSLMNYFDISEYAKSKLDEIASLQDATAEKDAIIEAQSETIGRLKSFVRGNFPLQHPSDIRYANEAAQKLLAQWEAESESEATE